MTQIISIVGKPNAGKSTLFNRIINQKLAVTAPVPGVTRDRVISPAEWGGKKFNLVDTGGIKLDFVNNIEKETLFQTKQAIQNSDVIIFLDSKEPLTAIDEEINNMLRKSEKPIIAAVNKIDDFEKHNWDEFYKFGYKDLIPISAEHGKNVNDLLDAVVKYLKEGDQHTDFSGIKVSIVGRPNVGKSSLFNKLAGEERSIVSNIPGTTRDAIDTIVKFHKKDYLFVDTAGLRKKNKVTDKIEHYSILRTLKAIDSCDISLLMVDASTGFEEQELKIAHLVIENNKGLIIIVNKWDLIEKDDKTYKKFEDKIYGRAPFLKFAPVLFISVLTGQRLPKIFELINEVYGNLKKRVTTAELNNFLNELKSEYSMPVSKSKKAKLNFMIQIKSEYPAFAVHSTHIELLNQGFTSFIINKLREKYGFSGAPIKIIYKNKS